VEMRRMVCFCERRGVITEDYIPDAFTARCRWDAAEWLMYREVRTRMMHG
jgi:hypothetical protein